jgi:hypothetical protein
MICTYALFCEEVQINSSTNQVSAESIFYEITMKEPGTTRFSFLVGIGDIAQGSIANIDILILPPYETGFKGTWSSPESEDDMAVYNAIFNCSNIPLEKEGIYRFRILNREDESLLSERYLKVSFIAGRQPND